MRHGDTVILECEPANINQYGNYKWELNGHTLSNTASTLVLFKVKPFNSGQYTCYNEGLLYSKFNVIVGSDSVLELRPSVSFLQASNGENITISCAASGNISLIEWMRCSNNWHDELTQENFEVEPLSNSRAIINHNGHISFLTLVNVNQDDSGCYQCRMLTGSITYAHVYISVIEGTILDNNILNGIAIAIFLSFSTCIICAILRTSVQSRQCKEGTSRRLALSVASSQSSNQISDLFNFDPLNFV
ncbi:hypothetical protein ACOME3_010009 [Neoechinorhynchus agilis]